MCFFISWVPQAPPQWPVSICGAWGRTRGGRRRPGFPHGLQRALQWLAHPEDTGAITSSVPPSWVVVRRWIRAILSLAPLCRDCPLPVPCAGREPGRAGVRYGLHKPHLLGHCTQPGFLLYFLRLACSLVAWARSCWPSLRSTLDSVQRSWDYTTWDFQVGLPEAVGELCCSPSWWCFL